MGLFDKMKSKNEDKTVKAVNKTVGNHLRDGEYIEAWLRSADSVGSVSVKMFVATNERVLLIEREAMGIVPVENIESISYEDIESMNTNVHALSALQIIAGINTMTLEKIATPLVKPFVDHVNAKREEAKSPKDSTTIINEPSQKSAAEQLKEYKELLDMDIINKDEFDKKKAELLG